MKKLVLSILMSLFVVTGAFAYDFEAGGIYYSVISEEEKTVAVACGNTGSGAEELNSYGVAYDIAVFEYMSWPGNSYKGAVTIPESVRRNDTGATYTVTGINMGAFCNCVDLEDVSLPSTLADIGIGAFSACSALTELYVPNNVKDVGERAFEKCSAMKTLHYPSNCSYIASMAFSSCGNQESGLEITGTENVTSVGVYAFAGAAVRSYPNWEKLHSIEFEAFYGSQIEGIKLSDGCVLGAGAFDECSRLMQLSIQASQARPQEFFNGCSAISLIRIDETTPPALEFDWAANVAADCVLEVPEEAVELYREAPNWKNFADIRAIGSTAVQEITDTKGAVRVSGSTVQISKVNEVAIFSIDGRMIFSGADCTVTLPTGIFIIKADGLVTRVLIP